ncbi:MAG: 3-ketoacyl-ACP reductase [Chloroflexi bacterium]|nr:3-ketoacyl-ACP reductase [Chloroflexota bacterium]
MGKVALITGAGRGIGHGIAKALAAEGYDIVVMDIHEESVVADAMNEIEALGVQALYARGDVTKPEDRAQALQATRDRFGALNVLVNNAGVGPRVRNDILEATEEEFEWVMRINLQGPYFLTQAAANWMVEQQQADPDWRGCIVNVSSMSATVVSTNRGEYCISKAGVSMATQLWAARMGEFGIPVYEIRPGIIKTPMTAGVTAKYDALIEGGLLVQSRWGFPEDIGRAVAMMARGDIAYSTGQVVNVDGGVTIQRL